MSHLRTGLLWESHSHWESSDSESSGDWIALGEPRVTHHGRIVIFVVDAP